MREIKFRFKHKSGTWSYITLPNIDGADLSDFDKSTMGEYTGTKDKKDKEIWEGDIVRTRFGITTVSFKGGIFDPLTCCGEYGWRADQLEVIGNIYDNKELLK